MVSCYCLKYSNDHSYSGIYYSGSLHSHDICMITFCSEVWHTFRGWGPRFVTVCDRGGQKSSKKAWHTLWTAPWKSCSQTNIYSKWNYKPNRTQSNKLHIISFSSLSLRTKKNKKHVKTVNCHLFILKLSPWHKCMIQLFIDGGAHEARRHVPPQNFGAGGTLWSMPAPGHNCWSGVGMPTRGAGPDCRNLKDCRNPQMQDNCRNMKFHYL